MLQTDILLVTATEVEGRAVLDLFQSELGHPFKRVFIGDKTYFDLGTIAEARVMMVQSEMGAGGPGGALLVVDEGIRELSPSAVILVGIAFGIDRKKHSIGDVLVSRQLFGYELQKIATSNGQEKVIARGDRPQASTRLLDRFRAGIFDWQEAKVDFGLILSGDKLIDSLHFRNQVLELASEAIGGEMEGIGIYSAAQRRKVDWIVVKAICDWVDGNKQHDEEQHQQLAAENAVRFTLHVLKQGGLNKNNNTPPFTGTTAKVSPSQAIGTTLRTYDIHSGWVVAAACGDNTIRVWNVSTGRCIATHQTTGASDIVWSPDSTRIASAHTDHTGQVWNTITGEYTLYRGHMDSVRYIAWSPDGTCIATASNDRTVQIWDPVTSNRIYTYRDHTDLATSVAWSPDGTRIASGSNDKTVRIWQAR